LIFNHNDNFVDPDSGGDTCDENEELNLGMSPQFSVDFS
jgi:hypothetical protein